MYACNNEDFEVMYSSYCCCPSFARSVFRVLLFREAEDGWTNCCNENEIKCIMNALGNFIREERTYENVFIWIVCNNLSKNGIEKEILHVS